MLKVWYDLGAGHYITIIFSGNATYTMHDFQRFFDKLILLHGVKLWFLFHYFLDKLGLLVLLVVPYLCASTSHYVCFQCLWGLIWSRLSINQVSDSLISSILFCNQIWTIFGIMAYNAIVITSWLTRVRIVSWYVSNLITIVAYDQAISSTHLTSFESHNPF